MNHDLRIMRLSECEAVTIAVSNRKFPRAVGHVLQRPLGLDDILNFRITGINILNEKINCSTATRCGSRGGSVLLEKNQATVFYPSRAGLHCAVEHIKADFFIKRFGLYNTVASQI